ncbi:unnamed protein product [Withania somnifera]
MKSRLYTPFVLRTLVDSELRSPFYAPLYPERKMSFAPLGARRSRGSREGKRMLHPARDDKERASSIDEQRIDGALGIALFFSPFLSPSSDPFVRNFFVCTEPLAESNPVPQDPISAIHPPCIYAETSKMMNGIVALHSPPMRKDVAEKNGTRFALLDASASGHGEGAAKRVVRNGKKDTTTSPLCWTAGANTVVSDRDREPIRIWILTCRWWAYHELGRGGWWFRDPVENASFMPRVLATARIHSVILVI